MIPLTIPIFKLSRHALSDPEQSLLSKGLSYVPTTHPNVLELQTELLSFFHRIRLHTYFLLNPSPTSLTNTPLHPPSTFSPVANMIPGEVLTFEKMVIKDVSIS